MFFGFFYVVKALNGQFMWAASAILLATVFDVLDGRVARLTGATSEFGVQYDSLCDLISFGLAPAILMYKFGLSDVGRIGWVICFLVYLQVIADSYGEIGSIGRLTAASRFSCIFTG